jgi:hypothetical protein
MDRTSVYYAKALEAVPKHWQDELACSHEQDSSHRGTMGLHPSALATASSHGTAACR